MEALMSDDNIDPLKMREIRDDIIKREMQDQKTKGGMIAVDESVITTLRSETRLSTAGDKPTHKEIDGDERKTAFAEAGLKESADYKVYKRASLSVTSS
jgi:hypothetical protein